MPRRHRVDKRRDRALTGQEQWALRLGTPDAMEYVFGSLEGARLAWGSARSSLLAACRPGDRPAAFWVFEGPAHLVRERIGPRGPALVTEFNDDPKPARAQMRAWRRECDELRAARVAWLGEQGLLSEAERQRLDIAEVTGRAPSWGPVRSRQRKASL